MQHSQKVFLFLSIFFGLMILESCKTSENAKQTKRLSGKYCSYVVDATRASSGTFKVSMRYNDVILKDEALFSIPSWAPGAYQFIEYGHYVHDITPFASNGDTLAISKFHEGVWQIQQASRLHHIDYLVDQMVETDNDILWVEKTILNEKRGYFNGTNVFGYINGHKNLPCEVTYKLPKDWRIATAIEIAPNTNQAIAKDYDELVDSPVMMGNFLRVDTVMFNKPHVFIIDSDNPLKADSIISITHDIIKAHQKIFSELPYPSYQFQFRLVRPSYLSTFGALEHRQSSSYYMPVEDWKNVRYDQLTNTISHEFFHLWNPKRIHGTLLGSKENDGFDYQNRLFTPNIWFVEGVTDYFADMLLVRNGIISQQAFLEGLLQRVLYMKMFPSDRLESLETLSLRLSNVENSSDMIPFYIKGTLVAMMLDIELRVQSQDRFSADSLLITLNEHYGKTEKPYPEDSLIHVLSSVSKVNLIPFYNKYIAGVDSLPFSSYINEIGLETSFRDELSPFAGYLALPDSDEKFIVGFVSPNSEAEKMGVQAGDEIISIDGITADQKDNFTQRVLFYEGQRIGDSTTVIVLRGKSPMTLKGIVGSRRVKRQTIVPSSTAKSQELMRRKEMFGF